LTSVISLCPSILDWNRSSEIWKQSIEIHFLLSSLFLTLVLNNMKALFRATINHRMTSTSHRMMNSSRK